MTYRNQKLRDDARDQDCQHCGTNDGTVVSAHANGASSGKGFGHKASDVQTAWLCHRCHSWLDQGSGPDPLHIYSDSRQDKWEMWARAFIKTMVVRFEKGFVRCA